MIVIEVNGIQYSGFTRANVQLRLDAVANTFSFDSATEGATAFPFKLGDKCKVFANDVLVMTGNIEIVTGSWDANTHTINFSGRDKTGDLLDSSISSLSDLTAPISLATICKRVIAHIGSDLLVIDEANPAIFTEAQDIASPEPGENAFQFLQKYSRKRQVLLTSNQFGNLVLVVGGGETIEATVIHHIDDVDRANNVVRADVSYDSTGRFNVYKTVSQLNTSAGFAAGIVAAESVADQGSNRQALDREIRRGRQLILIAEAPSSGKDTLDRATWEANMRRARGKVYNAEVRGFEDKSGNLWRLKTLPLIHDEFADIEARMLVNTISFTNGMSDGSETTRLGFLERNAYTLKLQEPSEDKDNVGSAFTGVLPGIEP